MKKEISQVFNSYPVELRSHLKELRRIVLETAADTPEVDALKETLKWGQPSYLTPGGSTIRLGCVKNQPQQYAMFFHCQTLLIETFREVYGDIFRFDGKRAIIFNVDEAIDVNALKHCISLALRYHKLKSLPLLGM